VARPSLGGSSKEVVTLLTPNLRPNLWHLRSSLILFGEGTIGIVPIYFVVNEST
jgi:hypothetical protein